MSEELKRKLVEEIARKRSQTTETRSTPVASITSDRTAALSDYLKKVYGEKYNRELAEADKYADDNFPKRPNNPQRRDGLPERFSPQSFSRRDNDGGLDAQTPVKVNPELPFGVAGRAKRETQKPYALSYDSSGDVIEVADDETLARYAGLTSEDVIEHEAGHMAYPFGEREPSYTKGSKEIGSDDAAVDHLTKPIEAINVLGKVTREYFKQTGKRFDQDSLTKYIDGENKKPEDSRFKGFSTDAQHMLEALRRSKAGEYKSDADGQFFKDAARLIPALVDNKNSFQDAVEDRLS